MSVLVPLYHKASQSTSTPVSTGSPSPTFDLDAELAELYAERHRQQQQERRQQEARRRLLRLRKGTVCILPFAFTDASGEKPRHGMVVGFQGLDVILVPITSHPPRNEFELPISYHCHAGVSGPWTIQCWKITPVARSVIFRIKGQIVAADLPRVMMTANAWFQHVVIGDTAQPKFAA